LSRRFAPHNDTKGVLWRNSAVLILDCHVCWRKLAMTGMGVILRQQNTANEVCCKPRCNCQVFEVLIGIRARTVWTTEWVPQLPINTKIRRVSEGQLHLGGVSLFYFLLEKKVIKTRVAKKVKINTDASSTLTHDKRRSGLPRLNTGSQWRRREGEIQMLRLRSRMTIGGFASVWQKFEHYAHFS
jgi:hypothetical protein